jgi:type I restriction enzyme, S subunit
MRMSKKAENTLLPKLRFPSFRNSGEWSYEKGDVLFGQISNKNHNSDLPVLAITQEHGAIPRDQIDYNVSVTDKSLESYKVVEVGDFIISLRSFQGGIEYSNYKGICSPAYVILRRRTDSISDFFRHYFKTQRFIADLTKNLEGLRDGKMISYTQFSELLLPSPSPKEQQKIADCLSSLDELITAENQKLDTLKAHKEGLMQQLFPAEGEKVPKLRFKEFKNSGEWVETTVEANCLVKGRIGYRGYTTEDLVEKGSGALVLGGKHIQHQAIDLSEPTFLSWDKYYESPEIMVEMGDIIFSQRGTLGDCAIIEKEIGPATINPSMVLLKNIACNPKFLYYILIGNSIQKEVKKNMASGAIPMLSQKQIKEFPFLVPVNPKEQEKITSCLSSFDALITAQLGYLEQLKMHKKGLMQGLFPNSSEVL